MCVVKKPKVQTTPEKAPIVIRNPYLDNVGPAAKALRVGSSSLRIERTGATTAAAESSAPTPVVAPVAAATPPPATSVTPNLSRWTLSSIRPF